MTAKTTYSIKKHAAIAMSIHRAVRHACSFIDVVSSHSRYLMSAAEYLELLAGEMRSENPDLASYLYSQANYDRVSNGHKVKRTAYCCNRCGNVAVRQRLINNTLIAIC